MGLSSATSARQAAIAWVGTMRNMPKSTKKRARLEFCYVPYAIAYSYKSVANAYHLSTGDFV
jgi:hypothetical protein